MRSGLRALLGALVLAATFAACNPNSIGRPCVDPGRHEVRGVQVTSPALECPSRLCLIEPSGAATGDVSGAASRDFRATCTATCQNDGDCDAETTERCPGGFVCAVVEVVGPFCCQKLCLCRDDLSSTNSDSAGHPVTPSACLPGRNPSCPNVPPG